MNNTQSKNTQRYNASSRTKWKDEARVRYLVEEILKVCGDLRSERFYRQLATSLPDGVIFQFLSEIRQDETIRKRGAVFTAKAKRYLQGHRQGRR